MFTKNFYGENCSTGCPRLPTKFFDRHFESPCICFSYIKSNFSFLVHSNKIVHLDLKPSNLLCAKDNRVKISDFGICQEFVESENDLLTYFGQGTPSFRSPESLKCSKSFKISGRAVDVWCLGVTLYVMVHGKLPFHSNADTNSIQMYDSIIKDSVIMSLRLTPELRHLLTGMLNKDPATRLTLRDIRRHHWLTV